MANNCVYDASDARLPCTVHQMLDYMDDLGRWYHNRPSLQFRARAGAFGTKKLTPDIRAHDERCLPVE